MIFKLLLDFLGGGIVGQIAKPLTEAYTARLKAQTDSEKLEADLLIKRLEGMRDIALAEANDRWSATRVGRWLIVVPWGIHWAYGCLIQILNPLFGLHLVVIALPPGWDTTAAYLIPAIVIGDVGTMAVRKIPRRSK